MWIVDHELTTQAMCQILQHYGTRDQQQPSNVVGLDYFQYRQLTHDAPHLIDSWLTIDDVDASYAKAMSKSKFRHLMGYDELLYGFQLLGFKKYPEEKEASVALNRIIMECVFVLPCAPIDAQKRALLFANHQRQRASKTPRVSFPDRLNHSCAGDDIFSRERRSEKKTASPIHNMSMTAVKVENQAQRRKNSPASRHDSSQELEKYLLCRIIQSNVHKAMFRRMNQCFHHWVHHVRQDHSNQLQCGVDHKALTFQRWKDSSMQMKQKRLTLHVCFFRRHHGLKSHAWKKWIQYQRVGILVQFRHHYHRMIQYQALSPAFEHWKYETVLEQEATPKDDSCISQHTLRIHKAMALLQNQHVKLCQRQSWQHWVNHTTHLSNPMHTFAVSYLNRILNRSSRKPRLQHGWWKWRKVVHWHDLRLKYLQAFSLTLCRVSRAPSALLSAGFYQWHTVRRAMVKNELLLAYGDHCFQLEQKCALMTTRLEEQIHKHEQRHQTLAPIWYVWKCQTQMNIKNTRVQTLGQLMTRCKRRVVLKWWSHWKDRVYEWRRWRRILGRLASSVDTYVQRLVIQKWTQVLELQSHQRQVLRQLFEQDRLFPQPQLAFSIWKGRVKRAAVLIRILHRVKRAKSHGAWSRWLRWMNVELKATHARTLSREQALGQQTQVRLEHQQKRMVMQYLMHKIQRKILHQAHVRWYQLIVSPVHIRCVGPYRRMKLKAILRSMRRCQMQQAFVQWLKISIKRNMVHRLKQMIQYQQWQPDNHSFKV